MRRWAIARSILVSLFLAGGASHASADAAFQRYVQGLWPKAKAVGLSRDVFDRAFAGITEPDRTVLNLARKQPEFTSTTGAYLAKAVTPIRIETGQAMKQADAELLAAIEKKYGVDRHILLGIWGMESNFGKDKGSMSVLRSLATLMYDGTRRRYADGQLTAAFRILKQGIRTPENFTGSWAAAMGHTQFIPTSYLAYAVDWTGDGKRDIWNSKEDALASTANYLAKAGWKADRPWGWEVKLPEKFNRALIGRKNWRPVADWEKLGLKPAAASSFSAKSARAFVLVPQGVNGPAFLVTDNFLSIMDYNISHSYAVAVGHLADRIRGGAAIQAAWPAAENTLTQAQRIEIQKRLSAQGFDTGGSDGRFGARTYEAVLAFQKSRGLSLDGEPDLKLLEQLRRGG
jgi:membrane-bound lytic murein transglycosylase B